MKYRNLCNDYHNKKAKTDKALGVLLAALEKKLKLKLIANDFAGDGLGVAVDNDKSFKLATYMPMSTLVSAIENGIKVDEAWIEERYYL